MCCATRQPAEAAEIACLSKLGVCVTSGEVDGGFDDLRLEWCQVAGISGWDGMAQAESDHQVFITVERSGKNFMKEDQGK